MKKKNYIKTEKKTLGNGFTRNYVQNYNKM